MTDRLKDPAVTRIERRVTIDREHVGLYLDEVGPSPSSASVDRLTEITSAMNLAVLRPEQHGLVLRCDCSSEGRVLI